jgi:hypothetical protein
VTICGAFFRIEKTYPLGVDGTLLTILGMNTLNLLRTMATPQHFVPFHVGLIESMAVHQQLSFKSTNTSNQHHIKPHQTNIASNQTYQYHTNIHIKPHQTNITSNHNQTKHHITNHILPRSSRSRGRVLGQALD